MKVKIYTMPTCGICKVMKRKLLAKNIEFEEYSLEEYSAIFDTMSAPVLQVGDTVLKTPTSINEWINKQ